MTQDLVLDAAKDPSKHCTLQVTLLNPEAVRTYLQEAGDFARICYDSTGDPEKIALHCIRSGHMSGMRSIYWKFHVTGMSRISSQQVVRHHVGTEINQRSQRYVKENEPIYVIPPTIPDINRAQYCIAIERIWEVYAELLAKGVKPEDARFLLPNAAMTEFNIALTPQAAFHFMHLRLCTRAQWEIRDMAKQIRMLILSEEPRLAPFLVPQCIYLHSCPETNPCGYWEQNK